MSQLNSNSQLEKSDSKDTTPFITILITTFSTIFLAELGDKTQLATLMLSAQSGRPLIIFTGAALALQIFSGGARFNAENVVPSIVAI